MGPIWDGGLQCDGAELNCWGVEKAADGDARVSTQGFSLCANPNLHPQLFFKVVMWQFPLVSPLAGAPRKWVQFSHHKHVIKLGPGRRHNLQAPSTRRNCNWCEQHDSICYVCIPIVGAIWSHNPAMSSKESRACHVSGPLMEDQQGSVERVAWPWMVQRVQDYWP